MEIEEKKYFFSILRKGYYYIRHPRANENYKYNEDEINNAIDYIYNPKNLKSNISDNNINLIENILVINMKKINKLNKLNLDNIIILIEQFTIEYNLLNESNVNYTDAIKLFFKNNLLEILDKDNEYSGESLNKFFSKHIPKKIRKECNEDYETCYYKYTKYTK